ncbi:MULTISPECIES: DegV family protein [Exiguobacterium]|uniref:EDD domain protein, DegV family n=1 Tax=Exiguobacterium aurantiacum TaxID=33987 RepID=A0A377FRF7_9BACL|nr:MULTISPECIES: DegV family protein [Exiguobacterium]STO07407.1 EDD domain protein, DegV family [Exiguobacterium aurantiacum]
MKIAYITDSTVVLPDSIKQHPDIHIVPLYVVKGDTPYKDGIEVDAETVYEWIDAGERVSTSQPAIGDFVTLYEELKQTYDMGIAVHLSSDLSGTYSASVQGAEIAEFKLLAIDSRAGIYTMGLLLEELIERVERGDALEDVEAYMKERVEDVRIELTIQNLTQMQKGGRISKSKALIGNMLQLKPVLRFEDGLIVPYQTVRTYKKAQAHLFEVIRAAIASGECTNVSIFHGNVPELAESWKQQLGDDVPIRVDTLAPLLGAHTGSGSIGISYLKAK